MIGKYPAKFDDKNRLFVPAKLRQALGSTFYATIGANSGRFCVTLYTVEDWEELERKYSAGSVADRSGPSNFIFYSAVECTPDKQFRFGIGSDLMEMAGLGRDVIFVGRAAQTEIWDAEAFRQYQKENLSPEKLLASLKEIGL